MAEAVLVAGSWEGKIGNLGFAERVSAREDRESGRERRVKRRRRRVWGCWFLWYLVVMTLNPRELASSVQHHLLSLWGCTNGKGHYKSHGVFERRLEVVGRRRRFFESWVVFGV